MTKRQQLLKERIKRLTRAGWTQTEIAKRCGASRVTIRAYQRMLGVVSRYGSHLVPAGTFLEPCLRALDSTFGAELPWPSELDEAVASGLVEAGGQLHPKAYKRMPKCGRAKIENLFTQAMTIKRTCSDREYFVN